MTAYPPPKPRAPIRAAPNGVTSIHIGVRPRLHPARANSSMTLNQPDETLASPIGSPLGPSRAQNLPKGSSSRVYQDKDKANLVQKAQAEYEAWLAKKEEREAGVGQPHEYGTRDWAAKGRVPARPSALMNGESSSMAQMLPMPQIQQPPPIMVRAVSHDQMPIPQEPVLVTPVHTPQPSQPQQMFRYQHMLHPAYDPQTLQPGHLSTHPSSENLRQSYASTEGAGQHESYPEGYPMQPPYPYQPQYPYDPTYGHGYDPSMYHQQYWAPPTWYAPQWDWHNQPVYNGYTGQEIVPGQRERYDSCRDYIACKTFTDATQQSSIPRSPLRWKSG